MRYVKILFLLLFSVGVKSQTVYKTPSGAKYHLATCRMVENVSKKLSVSDAVEIGLSPCKICKPPQSGSLGVVSKKKAVNGESKLLSVEELQKQEPVANIKQV